MKTDFKNELKYTDLLLPVLKILGDKSLKTEDEIIDICIRNPNYRILNTKVKPKKEEYQTFNQDIITKEVKDAIFYISKTPYVNTNNNQNQITQDGILLLNKHSYEIENIQKRNDESDEEKQDQIFKKENKIRNKIITEITKYYNIPPKEDYYKVILEYLKENPNHLSRKELYINILNSLNYPEEILNILTYGKSVTALTRIDFAISDLSDKEFIINDGRGKPYYITNNGLEYLDNLYLINTADRTKDITNNSKNTSNDNRSSITNYINKSEKNDLSLSEKLLEKVKSCDPLFFEKLVYDLLMKMDYNGFIPDHGNLTPRSHDNGIDGILYLGRLNTNPIYFQAKRWKNNIQKPEIQKFIGALYEKSANTGIFITTSDFTSGSKQLAKSANIELINGETLVELMEEYKVGIKTIEVVDEEYFTESMGK